MKATYVVGAIAGVGLYWLLNHGDKGVCYPNTGERVAPEYEITEMRLTVHWYDTIEQVQAAVSKRSGEDETGTEGYSECENYPAANFSFCTIWVPRPTHVIGDPNMDTLGHEVLHGLMGDFHE